MGVGHYQFFSKTLELIIPFSFIAPNKVTKQTQILYLLHGFSDNETKWIQETRITTYAENTNILIVMPTVYQSYYSNMVAGPDYFTFFTDELIPTVENLFSLEVTQQNRFICGNSMGGYGAVKLGLLTDLFSRVYSFSGALDIEGFWQSNPNRGEHFKYAFGSIETFHGSKNDLFVQPYLGKQTKFTLYCGAADFLLTGNQKFANHTKKYMDILLIISEGAHDWEYWDKCVNEVLMELKKIK
ncbi:alpha/beta hydrolase [Enterococcus sp.]|uniref:alpha/beta hydrolase n=1 Tax=Enterococcus sp. TaxID=35783 RepID=UPI003C71C0EC